MKHRTIWSGFSFLFFLIYLKKKKKEVFWDTGNKWIFLQTELGCGGGFWEEFTASAALSSMKGRTGIHFTFFFSSGRQQPAGLVVAATSNLAISQGSATLQVGWASRHTRGRRAHALATGADKKRVAATSHRSSSTQKKKKKEFNSVNTCTHNFSTWQYLSTNAEFIKSPKRADRAARLRECVRIDSPLSSHFRCLSILSVDLLPLSEDPWVSLPELRYILSICLSASFR